MDKNYKELIDIPEELDSVIFKAVEEGEEYNKVKNKSTNKKVNKFLVTAAVIIIIIGTTVVTSPEVISAIPGIGNIFDTILGNNKYKNNAKTINKSVESNGVKITLEQLSMDKGRIAATFVIKSTKPEKLERYMIADGEGCIFAKAKLDGRTDTIRQNNISVEVEDGTEPYVGAQTKAIDKNTVVSVFEMDIENVDTSKEMDLDIEIIDYFYPWKTKDEDIGKGEYKFDLKLNKDDIMVDTKEIKETDLGKIDNITYKLNGGLVSELGNRFEMIVSGDSIEDNLRISYVAKDDQGRYVTIGGDAGRAVNCTREQYLETKANLKDTKYIDLYPIVDKIDMYELREEPKIGEYGMLEDRGEQIIIECINGNKDLRKRCTNAFERRESNHFSAKYINADKDKSFFTIDELVGKSIEGSNNTKATVKSVTTDGEYTTFIFSEETGYYNSGVIPEIFDEDYKFYIGGKNYEISTNFDEYDAKEMTLKVKGMDKNKKYTLGAAKDEKDVKIDESKKIRIDLNK